MIYTASIYTIPLPSQGIRISVMSRHTLNDGKTPDLRINSKSYDYWYKELAPHEGDLVDYLKNKISFEEYSSRYTARLREIDRVIIVRNLAFFGLQNDITFLCVEEKADNCHRKLLAQECQRYEKKLNIIHL